MARKLHTDEEKALKAIIKAEQSKRIFRSIRDITGKPQASLTQVDVPDPHRDHTMLITLTTKEEVEHAILTRNQKHSKQSLATPFRFCTTFIAGCVSRTGQRPGLLFERNLH